MSDTDYTWAPVVLNDPEEARGVALSLYRECANFWRANEAYGLGEYIRPNRATGYSYECTTAGSSGAREPVWPTSIGATVPDGSVTWTCAPAAANGVTAISAPTASSEPTGLAITNVSVSESTKILATYSAPGSTFGQDFDAVFSFTLDGEPRRARQQVQIRKR